MSRRIDALIHQHVFGMGKHYVYLNTPIGYEGNGKPVPHYSTDIKTAFEVAEKLKLYDITSRTYDTPKKHRSYACIFYEKGEGIMAYAKTLPMAICLAALRAKGIEVKNEQD